MDTDPAPEPASTPDSDTPQLRRDLRDRRQPGAGVMFLGVVVWSDDPEVEPSVFVGTDQVTVMLATALGIHELLDRSPAYDGAAEFLATQPPPAAWESVSDVHDWLEALREATPYPACSLQQIPTRALDDVPRSSFEDTLRDALRAREHAVTATDLADPAPSMPRPEQGLGR
jgi:hypothetical protein